MNSKILAILLITTVVAGMLLAQTAVARSSPKEESANSLASAQVMATKKPSPTVNAERVKATPSKMPTPVMASNMENVKKTNVTMRPRPLNDTKNVPITPGVTNLYPGMNNTTKLSPTPKGKS